VGRSKIHGELLKLGIEVAQSTVSPEALGRHGAMKPGGSGRENSDMGRWDRRRLRGGQQNRGLRGARNSKRSQFIHASMRAKDKSSSSERS
jgi:hypothetical protein